MKSIFSGVNAIAEQHLDVSFSANDSEGQREDQGEVAALEREFELVVSGNGAGDHSEFDSHSSSDSVDFDSSGISDAQEIEDTRQKLKRERK